MNLRDALTDAIATEDRREWLSPDEVAEMVDDVLACLRDRSDATRDYWLDVEDSEFDDAASVAIAAETWPQWEGAMTTTHPAEPDRLSIFNLGDR